MHLSIPKDAYCEFLDIKPIENKLYAKCQIKVLYVSDEPNRNKTVITKEVAKKMANSLPGCPIVGFYNKEQKDFEEHNRIIELKDGVWEMSDITRPFGFVDLNAKVWFQKFIDDNEVEREYLMTEGTIWNKVYPEANRILTNGNNQSMELYEPTLDGYWTQNENSNTDFFIINDAIISKLCILGEDVEPCFEGAQIKPYFTLSEDFKQTFFSLMKEINKGGTKYMISPSKFSIDLDKDNPVVDSYINSYELNTSFNLVGLFSENDSEYMLLKNSEGVNYKQKIAMGEQGISYDGEPEQVSEEYTASSSCFDLEALNEYVEKKKKKKDPPTSCAQTDGKKKKDDEEPSNAPDEGEEKSQDDKDKNKKQTKKYSLNEIPEYVQLKNDFDELKNNYSLLQQENEALKQFKNRAELESKQQMIDSFSMLSDEDKEDVKNNINNYSLDEIEQKLSVICFRKKVSFGSNNNNSSTPLTFNLNDDNFSENSIKPDWVKRVEDIEKTLD